MNESENYILKLRLTLSAYLRPWLRPYVVAFQSGPEAKAGLDFIKLAPNEISANSIKISRLKCKAPISDIENG